MSLAAGGADVLEARRRWPWTRGASRRAWASGLGLVVAASFLATIGDDVFNPAGVRHVVEFATAAFSPETSRPFLARTGIAALTTLGFAVVGTMLSVVFGLLVAPFVSRSPWVRPSAARARPAAVGRFLLSFPRGLHEIVWGLLLLNVLGADPLVAVLAIGIPYGAITAKVFAEILDETPRAAFLALRASGASRPCAVLYGLLPQTAADMISYTFYRFECSIRSAAVLGVVGAGGLGYELLLSFRTLRYDEMWTLIFALVALSGLADWWSGGLRRRLQRGGAGRVVRASLLAWGSLLAVSAAFLRIDPSVLWNADTAAQLGLVVTGLWPPALPASSWTTMLEAALVTLAMSVVAIALAGAAAVAVVAFDDAESRRPLTRAVREVAKLLLLLCRAVPPPVWALLVLFVLLPGALPGAVALAVYNFGILGRLMSEAAENLDRGPTTALAAAGASRPIAWLYATAPRLLPRFLSLALYRWEVTTRETVIVGLVGAGGLGRLLNDALAAFDFHAVAGVLVALIVVTLLVDVVSAQARAAFR